ncbi:unnamed protein product [Porites evermanni]|uniref:Uncharacterized protein n=1 Tax=Porites evermanni TaxID=104178 RepID=A0ABN8Q5A7_9CNID|nr:unnamed protein product [Porites evermanni]
MWLQNILMSVAFICLYCSVEGFWLWNKPTKRPTSTNDIKTPLIIVPGTGGSQLQAKLNKPEVPHWYCSKKTDDYYTLWLRKSSLIPGAINCFADNMSSLNCRTNGDQLLNHRFAYFRTKISSQ